MPRLRVYVETTIPSFYFEQRRAPDIVAKRRWTRTWWDVALERYDLATSTYVLEELERGPAHRQSEWRGLVDPVPLLGTSDRVESVAEEYIAKRLMPARGRDAFHLAVCSVHGCEYLVTWDVQHLANAHKFQQIRKLNEKLGLYVPIITTPLELLGRLR